MAKLEYISVQMSVADAPTFEALNALESNPLDLSDRIKSEASTGQHLITHLLPITVGTLSTLYTVLKNLLPNLRDEIVVNNKDGETEIRIKGNFDLDQVARFHSQLLASGTEHSARREHSDIGAVAAKKTRRKPERKD